MRCTETKFGKGSYTFKVLNFDDSFRVTVCVKFVNVSFGNFFAESPLEYLNKYVLNYKLWIYS